MTDKDREAFEESYGSPRMDGDGSFKDRRDEAAYELWQGARDCYAPTVTEKQPVEVLVKKTGCVIVFAIQAIAAIRAAGVQFREEP